MSTWPEDARAASPRGAPLRAEAASSSQADPTRAPQTRVERFPVWAQNFEAGMASLAGAARHAGDGINALSLGLFRAGMRAAALAMTIGAAIIGLIFLARLATAPDIEAMAGTLSGALGATITRWTWTKFRHLYDKAPGGTS